MKKPGVFKKGKVILIITFSLVIYTVSMGYTAGLAQRKSLVFGVDSQITTLDPHLAVDKSSRQVCKAIYQTLVRYLPERKEIEPCLATSWETEKQNKEWVFHLRKGIKFHDGTSFNAESVAFSFERQLNSDHPFYEENCYYGRYIFGSVIDKIQVVDEYTVKFTLKTSYSPFIYALTTPAAMIVNQEAVKKYGDNFSRHPSGTGPFKLLTWEKNNDVVLERNEDYWEEKPSLSLITFCPIPDKSQRIKALLNGEIQITQLEDLSTIPQVISAVLLTDRVKSVKNLSLDIAYLALNMRKTPLNSLKMREALYRAIDREKLKERLYPEKVVAYNLIPPNLWGYNPDVQKYSYSPEKARELLEKIKPKVSTLNLWIPDTSTSYLPEPGKIAEEIKNDLAKIGIDVQIVMKDWRSYLEGCEIGEHDMALTGWEADFPDPDNFLYPLLGSQTLDQPGNANWSFYQSRFFQEILERARQVTDSVERTRLYQVAQKIVQQDIPCIPLFHTQKITVFSPPIEKVSVDYAGMVEFEKIEITE